MNTKVELTELRAIVGPKLNHLFVCYRSVGEYTVGVDGWHYKATTAPTLEALRAALTSSDAMLWPQQGPPQDRAEYEALE